MVDIPFANRIVNNPNTIRIGNTNRSIIKTVIFNRSQPGHLAIAVQAEPGCGNRVHGFIFWEDHRNACTHGSITSGCFSGFFDDGLITHQYTFHIRNCIIYSRFSIEGNTQISCPWFFCGGWLANTKLGKTNYRNKQSKF